jgi:hypothetical protein
MDGMGPERVLVQVVDVDVAADREITFGRNLAQVNRPGESGDSTLMMITLLLYRRNYNSRSAPISPAECRRSIRRGACC